MGFVQYVGARGYAGIESSLWAGVFTGGTIVAKPESARWHKCERLEHPISERVAGGPQQDGRNYVRYENLQVNVLGSDRGDCDRNVYDQRIGSGG